MAAASACSPGLEREIWINSTSVNFLADAGETGHLDDTLILFISDNGIPFPGAKTTLYAAGIHLPLIVSCPGQPQGRTSNALASNSLANNTLASNALANNTLASNALASNTLASNSWKA